MTPSEIISQNLFFILSILFVIVVLYFSSKIKSVIITKEIDEHIHPVVENEQVLHLSNLQIHYGKEFNVKNILKCDCSSTLFRIYNENAEKGTYIQFICVKCNKKATGYEFNWKEQKKLETNNI